MVDISAKFQFNQKNVHLYIAKFVIAIIFIFSTVFNNSGLQNTH